MNAVGGHCGQVDEIRNGSLKCRNCGLSESKSSKKSTTDSNNEFGTIQLDDIFGNYSPQKSPSRDNNNERRKRLDDEWSDDLCPDCSPPLANYSPILISNGRVKVEIPDSLPPPPSVITTTSQVTARNNYQITTNGNGVMSPVPVSVVLPNGLGIRSSNHVNGGDSLNHVTDNGHVNASLTCTLCNKNFKNERLAMAHQEKLHSKLARYSCPTCHGKFCYRGALNSHISSHHPHLAAYDCTTCGKTFKEKSNLSAHTTIVHAQASRPFKCEFCLSAFSKRVNLNYHRKRKHPQELLANTQQSSTMENTQYTPQPLLGTQNKNGSPHSYIPSPLVKTEPMEELGMEFEGGETSSVAAIIDTIASASVSGSGDGKSSGKSGSTPSTSSTRAEGDFKCQYCGRGFLFRNNLKCHLRTHIRDKKYTCEICEKSFIYKESLKNHMLLHSNELPYQCDICMKKFRDRSNRRKHVKNVHKFLLAANNGGGIPGEGNGTPGSSTSDPPPSQPKRRKRPPAKKKGPSVLPSSTAISPPPAKGVIVSPKSQDYGQQSRIMVKSEVISPEGQSQRSPEETYHGQSGHFKQQETEGHYQLPPSMNHPNVIVYPKPKLEQQIHYHSSSNSPDTVHVHSHPHSVISSSHSHQAYYETYGQEGQVQVHLQQQQQEGLPSYVSLMAPAQSISPDRSTGYDMSLVHGTGLLRTNTSTHHHQQQQQQQHHRVNIQEYSRSQGSTTNLMYSSPIMGGEVSGEGYHHQHHSYWIPPGANQNEALTPRPYYSDDPTGHGIPTVTEGTLLNPQSAYVNTSPVVPTGTTPDPSTNQIPPNHSHNYFYTDLAQFDLSHL